MNIPATLATAPQQRRACVPKSASRKIFSDRGRAARRKPAYALEASRENACIYEKARQDRQSLQTDPVGYQDQTNLYAYVENDPLNHTDPSGQIIDTILDVAFIIYDVGALAYDETTTGGANRGENLLALGADAAGAVVPFATGAGLAVRAARAADHAVDAGRAAAESAARSGPDFIVTADGAAMRPSAAANRSSLENAGMAGRPTTQTSETGTIHTTPGRDGPMDVRIMNGGSGGPPRVVTSRAGTNDLVQPSGERFPNGTPRQERRNRSHVELEP